MASGRMERSIYLVAITCIAVPNDADGVGREPSYYPVFT